MENWHEEAGFGITVCALDGRILSMNKRAGAVFKKSGGRALVGSNLLHCHPGSAQKKLVALLKAPSVNAYTIEKNGVRKLIYQAPWFTRGKARGLVELSLELPEKLPHHVRR